MKKIHTTIFPLLAFIVILYSCNTPKQAIKNAVTSTPDKYLIESDSINISTLNYKDFFNDPDLMSLIDTALKNNQEFNIFQQELEILKNEALARKGEYLPFVNVGAGAGIEKPGQFTREGAVEEQLKVRKNRKFPEPLGDYQLGAYASWEIDIWKKLRNSQKASVNEYLASLEGQKFLKTNLIAEIATSYYELLGLDNLLEIINQNIKIQSKALSVIRQQKEAAEVTQLAVNRFEAQLLNTKNLQYAIKQQIIEIENRINFLTARFPQKINRNSAKFIKITIDSISTGVPSELLTNRPDIMQAEFELEAAKLNVKAARANFYPSFEIESGIGFQAFDPSYLIDPESVFYDLTGDLLAPLINKKALKAAYASANAKQLQAIYNYEQAILNAYVDVQNQLANMQNLSYSIETKSNEVLILQNSINTANLLFNSAKADYSEVLLTQREALEARLELIEIKTKLLTSKVNLYRSLGGGWR